VIQAGGYPLLTGFGALAAAPLLAGALWTALAFPPEPHGTSGPS
jgi:hypothetical protein